ncbi:Zinc finger, CCHC-type superfamily [Sesbania bispinosa]|nr:Zinc finger, CCHC-type superfamily [Sesbania bispinosa]
MEDYFYLHIHYGGYFERDPQIKYGKIAVVMVDVDNWSYFEAIDILKEYGYHIGCKIRYLIPGKCMHNGLRPLSCDGHAMELAGYGLSCDTNVVELFIYKDVTKSDKSALVAAKGNAVHSELNLTRDQNLKERVGSNVAKEREAHSDAKRFDDSEEEREKNGDYFDKGNVFDAMVSEGEKHILPPIVKPQVGRVKKLRRREPNEEVNKTRKLRRRFTSQKCSICNQCGHNARSCPSRPPHDANVTRPNTLFASNGSQNSSQAIIQSDTITHQSVAKTSVGRRRAQVTTRKSSRGRGRRTKGDKGRISTPRCEGNATDPVPGTANVVVTDLGSGLSLSSIGGKGIENGGKVGQGRIVTKNMNQTTKSN